MAVSGKFLNIDDSLLKIMPLITGTKLPLKKFEEVLDMGNDPNDYAYVIPDGYIVLDFDVDDNKLQSGQWEFLKEYQKDTTWFKTPNGVHLWYKLPAALKGKLWNGQNIVLINSMRCDIKVGGKRSTATIKSNNKERECFNPLIPLPELPLDLYPTKVKNGGGLEEGDEGNRNMFFFKFIGRMLSACKDMYGIPVSKKQVEKIARTTNRYIPTPFSEEEFDKEVLAMIDTAFDKAELQDTARKNIAETSEYSDNGEDYYNDKGKLLLQKIAEYITSRYDIYYYREEMYLHEKGFEGVTWYNADRSEQNHTLGQIIFRRLGIMVKMSEQKDIYDRLIFMMDEEHDLENDVAMPIVTKNGYVIRQDGSIELDYSIFSTNVIDTLYQPDVIENEDINGFLNFITDGNEQTLNVIKFMLGHCLTTINVPQLGYFLVGQKGANGKSTLTEAISRMLGADNINSSSLEQLEEDSHKFIAASKLANMADDVDGSYIQSANMYKTFTAGSSVSVRQLYHNSMVVKPYCTMISSCNIMPIFKEISGGMDRRMVIIPFKKSVPEKERDPLLINKLSTEDAKSVWLNMAIEGLRYIRDNNGVLPECSVVEVENLQYKIKRDSVMGFLYDKCEIDLSSVDNSKREETDERITNMILKSTIDILYNDYLEYCNDEGIKTATHKNSMINKIQQTFGLDVRRQGERREFVRHK